MKDKITERIINLIETRADKGFQTYGVTMDRDDLTPSEWMQHAIEEALDLAIYLMKLKSEIEDLKYEEWHFKMSEQGLFDNQQNEQNENNVQSR